MVNPTVGALVSGDRLTGTWDNRMQLNSQGGAIRPILTLKSTVKVIGVQDVTEDSKNIYQLGL